MRARSPIPRSSRVGRLAAMLVLVLAGMLLAGGGTPAAAQPGPVPHAPSSAVASAGVLTSPIARPEVAGPSVDFDTPPSKDEAERTIYESQYRSINRWGETSVAFFTKYDGFVGTQLADQSQRVVSDGMAMRWGNFAAGLTSNWAQWAVSFNAIDALGANVDSITTQVVKALFTADGAGGAVTTSLIAAVLLILILTMVWQSLRRGGAALLIRRMAGLVLVFTMIFAMANAALSGGGRTDAQGYHPVPLSPGWVVKSVNDGVAQIANTPANLFVTGMQTLDTKKDPAAGSSLSCTNFQLAMNSRLKSQQSAATSAGSGGLVAITTVMDQLWAETGLQTWKRIQTGFNNPYGENVYCRILEHNSSWSTPFWSSYLTAGGAGKGWMAAVFSSHSGENAPFSPVTRLNEAATYVAWASCSPTGVDGDKITWKWADGWKGFQGGTDAVGNAGGQVMSDDNAQSSCDQWWNAVSDGSGEQTVPGIFNVSGDAGWIDDRTKNITGAGRDQVRDFLDALTGVNATGGSTATTAYAIGSTLQLGAFGVLDFATFLAKLFCAMFAFTLWFVLIGALFTENPFKDRILRAFNRFLGVTIFASMMTAIMTFVVIFTRILIALGDGMFGTGSAFGMFWAGVAPITALILVHLLFTKVFRMPSPVTINGARAWHKAGISGAMGAAAGAGIGAGIANAVGNTARATGRRAEDAAKLQSQRAGSAVMYRATGGRFGRTLAESRRSAMNAGARSRARDEAADDEVEKLKPYQIKRKAVAARKKELAQARDWHRQNTGEVAPGDLRGAIESSGRRAARRGQDLMRQAQDKLASSALAGELHDRADIRRQLRHARTGEDAAALRAIREEQRAKVSATTARLAAIMDSPAAATNRVRLGATRTADKVWNSPKAVGARADAAIIAGGTRAVADYVTQSDIGRATAVVSRYAAKPVRGAARGAMAVAMRSRNNAAVIEQYRAAMVAKAESTAPHRATTGKQSPTSDAAASHL